MKKILLSILIILSVKLFALTNNSAGPSKVFSPAFDSLEVFISISDNNTDVFGLVKSVLTTAHGVNYFAYCTNHSVFMVYIDKNIWRSAEDFLAAMKIDATVYGDKLSLKEGAFKDLSTFCNTSDPSEAASIKDQIK